MVSSGQAFGSVQGPCLGELERGRNAVGAAAGVVELADGLGRASSGEHPGAGDVAGVPAGSAVAACAAVGARLALGYGVAGAGVGRGDGDGGKGESGDGGELHFGDGRSSKARVREVSGIVVE
jgi:hypothetical protein